MEDINEKPFHKTTTFYTWTIACVLVLFILILKKCKQFPEHHAKNYTQMTLDEKKSYLNNFVDENYRHIESEIEKAVLDVIKSPSETDFVGKIDFSVDQYDTKQILATGNIDAPNSFGIKIRASYRCRFSVLNDNGDIEIQKVAIDE